MQQMDGLFGKVVWLLIHQALSALTYLTANGNTLFFRGYDTTNGLALWKSDGTTSGTVMVKDTFTTIKHPIVMALETN